MSLVVACGGADGVAMAADRSAITLGYLPTHFPTDRKLVGIPGRPLLVGFAGDVSAMERVTGALTGPPRLSLDLDGLREEVARRQRSVPSSEGYVELVLGAVTTRGPVILKYDVAGRAVVGDGTFAAIGKYAPSADFAMRWVRDLPRTLAQNVALAYRAVADAIDVSGDLKGPVLVSVLAAGEPEARRLSPDALDALARLTAEWRAQDGAASLRAAARAEAILRYADPDADLADAAGFRRLAPQET